MTDDHSSRSLVARIIEVLAGVFRVPADSIPSTARFGDIPAWDSMGHMELIVTLEREFGVTFPTYRLADLVSVSAIAEAMREQGVADEASS